MSGSRCGPSALRSGPWSPPQPQPRLAALDSLLAEVRAAGLPVTLTLSGDPVPLPDALDLSAYRIVIAFVLTWLTVVARELHRGALAGR